MKMVIRNFEDARSLFSHFLKGEMVILFGNDELLFSKFVNAIKDNTFVSISDDVMSAKGSSRVALVFDVRTFKVSFWNGFVQDCFLNTGFLYQFDKIGFSVFCEWLQRGGELVDENTEETILETIISGAIKETAKLNWEPQTEESILKFITEEE